MFWEKFANFRKICDITKLEKKPMIANPRNFPHKFEKRNTQKNDAKRDGEMRAVVWRRVQKREFCEATRTASDSRRVRRKRVSATAAPLWYPTLESLQSQATSAMHAFCFPFPSINDMEHARVCRPRIPGFALPLLLPSYFLSFPCITTRFTCARSSLS
jgi:hypothetical protein